MRFANQWSGGLSARRTRAGGLRVRRSTLTLFAVAVSLCAQVAFAQAERKIHPSAMRAAASGRLGIPVRVYFERGVAFDEARAAILASGGSLDDALAVHFSPLRHLRATVPSQSLRALAADQRVVVIMGPRFLRVKSDNAISASMSHVTQVHAQPYGLSGAGVAVSLFEVASAAPHVEFGNRLTIFGAAGAGAAQAHATHVAGTIAAAGLRAEAKGMAPSATLDQYVVTLGPNGEPLFNEPKENDLAARGVVADNNSWGFILGWNGSAAGYPVWEDTDAFFGAYDYDYTAPLDDISREKNVLFVHSSGNEGDGQYLGEWGEHRHADQQLRPITTELYCYSKNGSGTDCPAQCTAGAKFCEKTPHHDVAPFDTMNVNAAGKNVIAVGAVDSNGHILENSSRGPAKDGRVKPDVVARGLNVLSTYPGNGYATLDGTSMASPVVTGIAALLVEQWRKTFAANPRAAELKALIVAGATDLGNPGPDYTYGYGFVDAQRSIDLILAHDGNARHVHTTPIANGQQLERPLVVRSTQNLRVVAHWADPAKYLPLDEIATAKALVNDLDVKVIAPDGSEHFPWVLDKSNYDANARRGVNNVDNLEMIEIANAAPGVYRVIVNGTKIEDGQPQDVVIVSSARGARPCTDIQEPNDSAAQAYGNLTTNQNVSGGICNAGDLDFFKFNVTKSGPVAIQVTAGDTPLRVTLFGVTADVPAYTTATVNAPSVTAPASGVLRIEAAGARGVEPDYSFTLRFGVTTPPKRRAVR